MLSTRLQHRPPTPTFPSDLTGAAAEPQRAVVSGYRVLRRSSDRGGGRVHHGAADFGEARASVSLVTFDGAEGDAAAMRLISRLEELRGDCIPRVLDVTVDGEGSAVVVLEHLGDTVASALAGGTRLAGGEVVTLIAPILGAVSALHDGGFAHGAISTSALSIGAGGRPLLLGCERAEPLRRDADRAAGDDLRALADLLADLGASLEEADTDARARLGRAAEALRAGGASPFSSAFRSAAEVRLFEIADPLPLALTVPAASDRGDSRPPLSWPDVGPTRRDRRRAASIGARVRAITGSLRARGGALLERVTVERSGRREQVGAAPTTVRATAEQAGSVLAGGTPTEEAARWFRRRSARVGLATVLAVAVATIVVLALPGEGSSGSGADGARSPSVAATTATASTPSAASTPSVASAPSVAAPDAPTVSPTADEDAVAGLRVLMDAARRCAAGGGSGCWSSVGEDGSPLRGRLDAGGPEGLPPALLLPVEGVDLAEEEDFGDVRLVSVVPLDRTTPASVLMIRTEAGWRIRDAFGA